MSLIPPRAGGKRGRFVKVSFEIRRTAKFTRVSFFGVADCSFGISSGNFKYKKKYPDNPACPVAPADGTGVNPVQNKVTKRPRPPLCVAVPLKSRFEGGLRGMLCQWGTPVCRLQVYYPFKNSIG